VLKGLHDLPGILQQLLLIMSFQNPISQINAKLKY